MSIQPQCNLLARKAYETSTRPIVEEFGSTVFSYFALASGMLAGKCSSREGLKGRVCQGSVESLVIDEAFVVVGELRSIAAEVDSAPATVTLAWLLAKEITAPIA